MQVMDDRKKVKIMEAAAKLFAEQPFHKVLLSDVAEMAAVGKGTLYIYFKSKEDLYFSVHYSGFSRLVDRLNEQIDEDSCDPMENLEIVVRETVDFAFRTPHLFEVMRRVTYHKSVDRTQWNEKRKEFKRLIESIIRCGIAGGVFSDPHPELTARYIPGLVRSAIIDEIENLDRDVVTEHILWFVRKSLTREAL